MIKQRRPRRCGGYTSSGPSGHLPLQGEGSSGALHLIQSADRRSFPSRGRQEGGHGLRAYTSSDRLRRPPSPGRSIVVFGTAVPNPRFAPRFHSLTPSAWCPLGTRSFPAPPRGRQEGGIKGRQSPLKTPYRTLPLPPPQSGSSHPAKPAGTPRRVRQETRWRRPRSQTSRLPWRAG